MKYYLIYDANHNVIGKFCTNDGSLHPEGTEVDQSTYDAAVVPQEQ